MQSAQEEHEPLLEKINKRTFTFSIEKHGGNIDVKYEPQVSLLNYVIKFIMSQQHIFSNVIIFTVKLI